VDFALRYRGPLKASTSKDPNVKNKCDIRNVMSGQLEQLWKRSPLLNSAQVDALPLAEIKARRLQIIKNDSNSVGWCRAPLGGFVFVPLITRLHALSCQLDIKLLRREDPGAIVNGGDLDNRLKTLFDALRMPHEVGEIGDKPSSEGQVVFCLMEDDSLVTKLTISTHLLLDPLMENEKETDVNLDVHVTVQATAPTWANSGLPQA
jgi:hypothetical protein